LCADRYILTCAHVVDPDMRTPPPDIFVDFPFAEPRSAVPARVVSGGWFPAMADGTGDIAVLEVSDQLPPSAMPAPLRVSDGVSGHRFRASGFPAGHDGGVTSRGVVVGPAETQWLQLQAESALGFSLEAGFSGAPLWDEEFGAVVGIVVTRERPRGALGDPRTGYAITIEVIERYWEPLRPWVGWRLDHDPDLRAHWSPRARGVARQSAPGWNFTGRRAAISRLVSWLAQPAADEPVHVVIGGPGSGKSAVLARLVTLADPMTRATIGAEDPDQLGEPTMVPPVGAISLAIRCSGLDLSRVCQALSRFHQPTTDPDVLIWDVVRRGEPLVIVVDALDEAVNEHEARAIAVRLLRPLGEAGAPIGVKVLVATRRGHNDSLLRALGPAACTDLDDLEFFDADDIVDYAQSCLVDGSYRDLPDAARQVAEAIARRSRPSFLVAGLTARAWARKVPVDVTRPGWEHVQSFPADVDDAMREYLQRLPDPDRALSLLRILAHGRQPGLPLDLWEAVATAYLPTISRAEIDGLLRAASSYVVGQQSVDDEPAIQLFHQALADHLLELDTSGLVERTIADVLIEDTRTRGGWRRAREYARRHAATHAAAAGEHVLEQLVTDPEFLLVAERGAVLRALHGVRSPNVKAIAATYRAAAHALTSSAPANAAHLELAARRAGDDQLAERIRSVGLAQPFITRFTRRSVQPADHLTLTAHTSPVTALVWGTVGGRPELISGAEDGTVMLWNPTDGTLLDSFDGDGAVSSLSWVEQDGATLLAAARDDRTVALWDLARQPGTPRLVTLAAPDFDDHEIPAWQGAVGQVPPALEGAGQRHLNTVWGRLNDEPVLVHGYDNGTVLAWRIGGDAALPPVRAHLWGGAIAWGDLDDGPVLVTTGNDQVIESGGTEPVARASRWLIQPDGRLVGHGRSATVRLWDPVARVERFNLGMDDVLVNGCVLFRLGDRAVLAAACDDWRVRVVDIANGTELAAFPGSTPLARGSIDGVTVIAAAVGDHTVQVRDPLSGTLLHTFNSNDTVTTLAWGELDGRPVLAGAGDSGRIQLWSAPESTEAAAADAPPSAVRALSWHEPDGRAVLAAGSADGRVDVLDLSDPTGLVLSFAGHDDGIARIAWGAPGGRPALATATAEGDVAVWDPFTGQHLLALPRQDQYLRLLSWVTLDGQDHLAVASAASDLRLWRLDGTTRTVDLPQIGKPIRYLRSVLQDGQPVILCGIDGYVQVYDPVTWEELYSMSEGATPADRAPETSFATGFPDGTPVTARGGMDGELAFWRPRGLAEGYHMPAPVAAHEGPVLALSWRESEAATVLASGGADGMVRLWDPQDLDAPTLLHTIDGASGAVQALTWSRIDDTDMLAVGTAAGEVHIHDADDGELLFGLQGLGAAVTALAAHVQGTEHLTAIGTADGNLGVWLHLPDGGQDFSELSLPSAVSALSWSYQPDGWPVLAVGTADGGVWLWDPARVVNEDGSWNVDDPAILHGVASGPGVPVSSLTWSWEGPPTLIGGDVHGTIRTWDVTTGTENHVFNADKHADTVLATGRLGGRTVLAAAGHLLRVWDLADGTPLLIGDDQRSSNDELLFGDADGRTIMAQNFFDGVRVWDPLEATQLDTVATPRDTRPPLEPRRLTQRSAFAIGAATGLIAPTLALGRLNERPALAVGTPTGLITLVDLRDGTQRTIDWYEPVYALGLGPDNLVAIGDPQGYTVIRVP
jgi:WD40 repeat protein